MAFITYILLAGIAFGIQKRLVPEVFCDSELLCLCQIKRRVCRLCVKVQSRGPWSVCQHRPRVGHHWGLGDVAEFVPADSAQRPLHLRPHRLQWIQICWVNVVLSSVCMTCFFDGYFGPNLFVTLYIKFHLKQYWILITMCHLKTLNTSVYYLPLLQDDLHNDMWLTVWQRWLLCGPCLGLLCSYVLYCKYLLPLLISPTLHLIVLGVFNIFNAKQIWH